MMQGVMADEVLVRWRSLAAEPGAVLLDGFHAVKHALRFAARVDLVLAADRRQALALAGSLAPDLTGRLADRLVEGPPGPLAALTGGRPPAGRARPAPAP